MKQRTHTIAVIGSGFSGTMTALHLIESLPPCFSILLCERSDLFARGLAYSTANPHHLLNVRAANMSAFAGRPGDFVDWITSQGEAAESEIVGTTSGLFASRGLYGRYLACLLRAGLTPAQGVPRLGLVADEAIDLAPVPDGSGRYDLTFAGGRRHRIDGAILAIGTPAKRSDEAGRVVFDAWEPDALAGLAPDRPVLILGSGLSMVDVAIALLDQDFTGPIVALSRRGLAPRRHAPTRPWTCPNLSDSDRLSLTRLTRRVRREIKEAEEEGHDWRDVIDSLRPLTADLWRGLPKAERDRFLRHLRPWWDVHRHRLAPPVADLLDGLRAEGRLKIDAGRIVKIGAKDGEAEILYRPRGCGPEITKTLRVQRVLDASGLSDARRARDPLMLRLLERGLARLDPHGMGLDVTDRLETLDASGTVVPRIWAVGPVVRGVFWECVAVPDIRRQVIAVAGCVAAAFH